MRFAKHKLATALQQRPIFRVTIIFPILPPVQDSADIGLAEHGFSAHAYGNQVLAGSPFGESGIAHVKEVLHFGAGVEFGGGVSLLPLDVLLLGFPDEEVCEVYQVIVPDAVADLFAGHRRD